MQIHTKCSFLSAVWPSFGNKKSKSPVHNRIEIIPASKILSKQNSMKNLAVSQYLYKKKGDIFCRLRVDMLATTRNKNWLLLSLEDFHHPYNVLPEK